MTRVSAGIDFGTSNSSVSLVSKDEPPSLIEVEGVHTTMPSAMFFFGRKNVPSFGREAVNKFTEGEPGRFMRSLKRVLGTQLMSQGTMVNGTRVNFNEIIGSFVQNLKDKLDTLVQMPVEHVVMGRPVHFIDNDEAGDRRAENELKAIAKGAGFKNVEFQFEPIAAAFAHEATVENEKLALVVDIGGGTSDFTLIKMSKDYISKPDRSDDILANTGVRVGGNDFDKALSLRMVMPYLGYHTTYGVKNLYVSNSPFVDLSNWNRINSLYTYKHKGKAKTTYNQSNDKKTYGRLLTVLEKELGHRLLGDVENIKIKLTEEATYHQPLDYVEQGLIVKASKTQFEDAIAPEMTKIDQCVSECMAQAGVSEDKVGLIVLTGGSTDIPLIQQYVRQRFDVAELSQENKLSSVALGLSYDAARKFGLQ